MKILTKLYIYIPKSYTIKFDFKKNEYNIYDNKKKLFWSIWNFLSDILMLTTNTETEIFDSNKYSTTIISMSADYFARAMLIPKEIFLQNVIEETDSSEKINVFSLANKYNVQYLDIIARCRDLNIIGFV